MTTMTCPPAEQLKAFYLGHLADELSDELVVHVGTCSACQAELESVVDADDSLIVNLRDTNAEVELGREPACEAGMLRALGALAEASESADAEAHDRTLHGMSLPKTIGEYEIVRALGQGGMGQVYLAKHSKLGRLVAIKVLAGHRVGDRRAGQRFEGEMLAIGRLNHSNIVTAHDAREIDGRAVLVTEFIDGLDLGELMQRTGPLSVADACEIVRLVAVALQYTSDQGFVHRDVKPSNIMLSASGEVKLLDLGLARLQFGDKQSADVTGTGQTMGTADYISPEQVNDSRQVDVRSDIYSLGATLFKLLAGRAPFADARYSSAFAKMTAHVSTTPAILRTLRGDVPNELAALVATMLAKRPEDRPQRPDGIAARLSDFAHGNNLQKLAQEAIAVNDAKPHSRPLNTSTSPTPRTQSYRHRPVKRYVALAAGMFAMLFGFCMGIMITITNPDGSKTIVQLPPGSKVEVSEGAGSPSSETVQKPSGQLPDATTLWPSLEFAIVQDELGKEELIFVTLGKGVEVPRPVINGINGEKSALVVARGSKQFIGMDKLSGHVSGLAAYQNYFELPFDITLSRQMLELTKNGIGKQLAIIFEGTIIAAPRIVAPISSKVQIPKVLTPEQIERLSKWILSQSQASSPQTDLKPKVSSTNTPREALQNDRRAWNNVVHAFSRSLSEDRKVPITESNLEQLVAALKSYVQPNGRSSETMKNAVRETWPFRGVSKVFPGVPSEANWLLSDSETGTTFVIDPKVMLSDATKFFDNIEGQQGAVISLLSAIEEDPQGPRLDVDSLIENLGSELIFCVATDATPVKTLAVSIKNVELARHAIRNETNSLFPEIGIVGNYLVSTTADRLKVIEERFKVGLKANPATNLKQIGIAFLNFESAYKILPASKNLREGGIGFGGPAKHPFSWRVAILPYVEQVELFQKYDFNEPWDSEKNLKLVEKMPAVYRSPNAPRDQKPGETNYLGFSGKACAMGDEVGVKLAQISDGTSATALMFESKRSVPWTKPEDLEFDDYDDAKLVQPFDGKELNWLMVDGRVLSLIQPIDWELLGRIITKDGGEAVKFKK